MSNAEGRTPERQGFQALEGAVGRVLEELARVRLRAEAAHRRSEELEGLLRSFEAGEESPGRMQERLTVLEAENEDLRARIERGRETAERLLARIRFLEDQA